MRINKKHKFVFISTPKNCTHTIYDILDKYFSVGLIDAGFHNNKIGLAYRKYFRWTIVRNPYSRAVSVWWSACRLAHKDQYKFRRRCGSKDDFIKFITWLADQPFHQRQRDPLMLSQTEWLNPIKPIHCIHTEGLEENLKQLPFWIDGIEIKKLNTTAEKINVQQLEEKQKIVRPPWQEFYKDEKAKDAVLKYANSDFEQFGYPMEIE